MEYNTSKTEKKMPASKSNKKKHNYSVVDYGSSEPPLEVVKDTSLNIQISELEAAAEQSVEPRETKNEIEPKQIE